MADTSDEILRTYIDTVLRLQQEREESKWSDQDLQQAARDAGMTDADLAHVRQQLDDCLNRGQGFVRYQNWDDAIGELEQATALAPNNTDALNALTTAYAGRWQAKRNRADHDAALHTAERVLELDSRNDQAIRTISALRTNRSELLGEEVKNVNAGPKRGVIGGLVIAGIIIIVLFITLGTGPKRVDRITPKQLLRAAVPPALKPEHDEEPPPPPLPPGNANTVFTFGHYGTGPGLFVDARAIAVNGTGQIYVAEYSNGRIQVFDSAGNFLRQWSIGKDVYVKGIAVDMNENLYVVHDGLIHRYNGLTGELIGSVKYPGGAGFVGVAVMADGGLVAAWDGLWRGGLLINPKSEDKLVIFDHRLDVVRTIKSPISSISDNVVFDPKVAVDGLGNIYMAEESDMAIYRFTPEGKYVDKFSNTDDRSRGMGGIRGLAVDGRGHLFTADFSGIHEFDDEGRYLGSIAVKGSADAIAFNSRDELYAVSRTKVTKFTAPK